MKTSKSEFLEELKNNLSGLPQEDIEKSLEYYSEMIDDRIEDGMDENEAVDSVGSIREIAEQIVLDTPLPKIVKAKAREKAKSTVSMKAWEIVLLILGFPVWFPLTVAAFAVILALYITVWAVVFSLYCTEFAVMAGTFFSIFKGGILLFEPNLQSAVFFLGTGVALFGASVLMFFAFNKITGGIIFISKKTAMLIKSLIIGNPKKQNEISNIEEGAE